MLLRRAEMRDACGSKSVDLVYLDPPFGSKKAYRIILEVALPIPTGANVLCGLPLSHESVDRPAQRHEYREESDLPAEHGFENEQSVGVGLAEHPPQPGHVGEVEQAPVCGAEADEQRSYKHRIGQSPEQDVVGCGPGGGMAELTGHWCVMHSG